MSDKKEIATLSIKISVDSTDLDKLEAQLKRIEGLMVCTGLKQPVSGGVIANSFVLKNGQVFIDEALIPKTEPMPTIKYTVSGLHSDEYKEDLKQVVKQAIRPVIRQHMKVERVKEETDIEKLKQQVEPEFSQLHAQINGIQCASVASEQSTAQHISGLKRQIAAVSESLASLKESADSSAEAVRNTQEAISEAIKKAVIEDLARGGPLCRALR